MNKELDDLIWAADAVVSSYAGGPSLMSHNVVVLEGALGNLRAAIKTEPAPKPDARNPILRHFDREIIGVGEGAAGNIARQIAKEMKSYAQHAEMLLPPSAEKSAGLRKLLEARDCFVRAATPEGR